MAPPSLLALCWTAAAFATTPSSNNRQNLQTTTTTTTSSSNSDSSPWSPAEWRFDLNFGRETNSVYSSMPGAADWGASGARIVLPVEVLIEAVTSCSDDCSKSVTEFLGGSAGKADRLTVLDESAIYVSLGKGQETVVFEPQGAWKIHQRRTGKPGDAGELRFYLDIAKKQQQQGGGDESWSSAAVKSDVVVVAARRNDVTLLAERYYCTAKCWRSSELEIGMQRFHPIQNALNQAQCDINERLQHETGDRRLDGTNPIETALASIDMAVLVKKRDDLLVQLREAERTLPSFEKQQQRLLSKPGKWPGNTERLVIAPGTITVKRKAGNGLSLLGGGEEFHIVGTWTATPYEGLSEYVEEEEEEEDEKEDDSLRTRSSID